MEDRGVKKIRGRQRSKVAATTILRRASQRASAQGLRGCKMVVSLRRARMAACFPASLLRDEDVVTLWPPGGHKATSGNKGGVKLFSSFLFDARPFFFFASKRRGVFPEKLPRSPSLNLRRLQQLEQKKLTDCLSTHTSLVSTLSLSKPPSALSLSLSLSLFLFLPQSLALFHTKERDMRVQRSSVCAALAVAAAIALAASPAAARGVSPGSLSNFFVGVSLSCMNLNPFLSDQSQRRIEDTRLESSGCTCLKETRAGAGTSLQFFDALERFRNFVVIFSF